MSSNEGGLINKIYLNLYEQINKILPNYDISIKQFNYFMIISILIISLIIHKITTINTKTTSNSANKIKKSNNDPNKGRKLGNWTPVNFPTPKPQEFKHWDIEKTQPIPYRAFKHNYKVNMGIRNMDWNNWIELDNQWLKYHNDKLNRVATTGNKLYESSDEAIDAAYELCEEFRNWLPERYPKLFKRTTLGVDNLVTGEQHIFLKPQQDIEKGGKFSKSNGIDPILIAAKMVQDDLAIMIENEDGEYYLKSGAIMLAGFWRFRDKFNKPLSYIHDSGDVPKYKENLKNGMEKFFVRLTCDKPVVRNNYFIQTDDDLPWSRSIGDENNEHVGWNTAENASKVEQIYFRSERQSLRRLPRSGGVVFTIRTYFTPLTEICKEPHVPRRLLDGMKSWEDDVADYKGFEKYKDVVLPYLEMRAEQQENEEGYTMDNEPQVYPF